MNKTDPLNYIYQLLAQPLKDFVPTSTAIKGDFTRYGEAITQVYSNIFWHKDYDANEPNGKEVHIHFNNKCDVTIESYDATQFYNYIQIFITDNRNHIEFIASNVNNKGEEPLVKEESEYIYEPDTKQYYIYYSKTSLIDNEEIFMTHAYDDHGREISRSMNGGPIKSVKVKTKTK